jgi:methionyl-tRNA formyltransferase
MLTIGILCSGGLGLGTLTKIAEDYSISFVLTDSNSTGIIDFAIQKSIPIYVGNPRGGKGFNFIKDFKTEVIASINYLFLIEEDIINHSNLLTFNIHGSLLPKYRGRTPHVWAIINGETMAGITAHVIDAGCDTGKIIHQIEIPINTDDTGAIMLEKYAQEYYPLVKKVLKDLTTNRLELEEQNEEDATYFGKRSPKDGEIDWSWDSEKIRNWVRAQANPYPGAYSYYENQKIIIDKISISDIITKEKQDIGEIIQVEPNIIIKTKNGAVQLDTIRTESCIFTLGKILGNENRK